jgi:hypothetical protein
MITPPPVQQWLTFAAVVVECTALLFVVTGILTIAFPVHPPVVQSAPPAPVAAPVLVPSSAPVLQSEIEPHEIDLQPLAAPIVQVTRKPSRCEQLRQRCASEGIQWRNAHGKGKHLTTQQMQDYLDERTGAASDRLRPEGNRALTIQV